MHQDATWYRGRHQPRRLCVRWGPSSPSPKRAQPPIFGPCPLWLNGWMDEDATWYGSRPRPRPHCVRQGPSFPAGHNSSPLFGPCLLWPRSPISATAELVLFSVFVIAIGKPYNFVNNFSCDFTSSQKFCPVCYTQFFCFQTTVTETSTLFMSFVTVHLHICCDLPSPL